MVLTEDSRLFRPAKLVLGAVFPAADRVPSRLLPDHLHYGPYPHVHISHREDGRVVRSFVRWMGEQRPPRKDEWFISGADPNGYLALNDLDTSYPIGELCFAEARTTTIYTFV